MKILTTETQLRYTIERAKLIRADYHAPPAPVVPVTTEWNPLTLANATLSNNDLTNTNTGIFNDNGDPQGDRVVGVLSSGKYYFEMTLTQDFDVRNGLGIGIGSAGGNYVGFNYSPAPYGAILFGPPNYEIFVNDGWVGWSLSTEGTGYDGNIFGIAVDLDNGLVWFNVVGGPDGPINAPSGTYPDPGGGWNGVNGNPSTGVGGVSISPGAKTIFGTYADSDSTESLTLNLGATPFAGSVPAGFTPGWPSTDYVPAVTGAVWDATASQNVTLSNGPPPPFSGPGLNMPNLTVTNLLGGPGPPGGSLAGNQAPYTRLYFEVTIDSIGSIPPPSTVGGTDGGTAHVFNIGIGEDEPLNGIGSYTHAVTGDQYIADSRGAILANGSIGPFPYADPLGHNLVAGDVIGFAIDTLSPYGYWAKWITGPGATSTHYAAEWAGGTYCSPPGANPFTNAQGMHGGGTVYGWVPIVAWGSTDNNLKCTFNLTGPFVQYLGEMWAPPYSSNSGTGTNSNNNLTFTATNSNGVGVRSTSAHLPRQNNFYESYYFEITLGATLAGTKSSFGICTYQWEAWLCSVYTYATYAFMVYRDGNAYFNQNTFTPTVAFSLGALLPNDTLQFAVRIGTTPNLSYVWVRVNRGGVPGNWNGNPTANPNTVTGGFDITSLFGGNVSDNKWLFACACLASAGDSATVNFGHTPFVSNTTGFPAWENTFSPWGTALEPAKTIDTTLSNSNRTAQNAYPPIPHQGAVVAATSGKTAGKYYFEITKTIDIDGDSMIGVAVVGADYLQFNIDGTGGIGCSGGYIMANGSRSSYYLGRWDQMDNIGVAVDLDNRMVWMKIVDGWDYWWQSDWNGEDTGTCDPATNLNGIPLIAGTIVPIVAFAGYSGDQAGNAISANFGQVPFAGQVPEGFTAGWPA